MESIKNKGIEQFVKDQKIRINILNYLLTNHDDGRTKNLFCIGSTLLPVDKLQEVYEYAQKIDDNMGIKERSKRLRAFLNGIANSMNIDLKLKTKNVTK